jgi:uncharacterized protein YciI
MTIYAVTREPGASWDAARTMREQEAWDEHAVFMDALVDEGFVVAGGPLGDGARILLIVDAASEEEIAERLDDDPWAPMRLLRTVTIDRWHVLLGGIGPASHPAI